jgi:branched-subunit amino acid transport protein
MPAMPESGGWVLLVILGMTVVTIVTRGFFFFSEREWQLPGWVQRGLQFAPIAALAAVIAPELVMTDGAIGHLLRDARTWGALAAVGFYFARRRWSFAMLGAIVVGMAVYLPLRLLLNW